MTEQEKIKHILEHQRALINRLLRRLKTNEQEQLTISDLEEIFWYRYRPLLDEHILGRLDEINGKLNNQNFTCRFSEDNERTMKLMLAPTISGDDIKQVRQTGLKEIRDFTKDASELIIIDPYIFSGETAKAQIFIDEFKKSTRIGSKTLAKVHIIYNSTNSLTVAIKNGIKKLASENGCTISNFGTKIIHDRVWIKNKSEAIIVGTSFGGIGNRLSFILELPDYDLKNLLEYLLTENCFAITYS